MKKQIRGLKRKFTKVDFASSSFFLKSKAQLTRVDQQTFENASKVLQGQLDKLLLRFRPIKSGGRTFYVIDRNWGSSYSLRKLVNVSVANYVLAVLYSQYEGDLIKDRLLMNLARITSASGSTSSVVPRVPTEFGVTSLVSAAEACFPLLSDPTSMFTGSETEIVRVTECINKLVSVNVSVDAPTFETLLLVQMSSFLSSYLNFWAPSSKGVKKISNASVFEVPKLDGTSNKINELVSLYEADLHSEALINLQQTFSVKFKDIYDFDRRSKTVNIHQDFPQTFFGIVTTALSDSLLKTTKSIRIFSSRIEYLKQYILDNICLAAVSDKFIHDDLKQAVGYLKMDPELALYLNAFDLSSSGLGKPTTEVLDAPAIKQRIQYATDRLEPILPVLIELLHKYYEPMEDFPVDKIFVKWMYSGEAKMLLRAGFLYEDYTVPTGVSKRSVGKDFHKVESFSMVPNTKVLPLLVSGEDVSSSSAAGGSDDVVSSYGGVFEGSNAKARLVDWLSRTGKVIDISFDSNSLQLTYEVQLYLGQIVPPTTIRDGYVIGGALFAGKKTRNTGNRLCSVTKIADVNTLDCFDLLFTWNYAMLVGADNSTLLSMYINRCNKFNSLSLRDENFFLKDGSKDTIVQQFLEMQNSCYHNRVRHFPALTKRYIEPSIASIIGPSVSGTEVGDFIIKAKYTVVPSNVCLTKGDPLPNEVEMDDKSEYTFIVPILCLSDAVQRAVSINKGVTYGLNRYNEAIVTILTGAAAKSIVPELNDEYVIMSIRVSKYDSCIPSSEQSFVRLKDGKVRMKFRYEDPVTQEKVETNEVTVFNEDGEAFTMNKLFSNFDPAPLLNEDLASTAALNFVSESLIALGVLADYHYAGEKLLRKNINLSVYKSILKSYCTCLAKHVDITNEELTLVDVGGKGFSKVQDVLCKLLTIIKNLPDSVEDLKKRKLSKHFSMFSVTVDNPGDMVKTDLEDLPVVERTIPDLGNAKEMYLQTYIAKILKEVFNYDLKWAITRGWISPMIVNDSFVDIIDKIFSGRITYYNMPTCVSETIIPILSSVFADQKATQFVCSQITNAVNELAVSN